VSKVLAEWNRLSPDGAASEILPCCGSIGWAHGMAARRPLLDEASLLAAADETWHNLTRSDWMEAFQSHLRIGGSRAERAVSATSAAWSAQEQQEVRDADAEITRALEEGNREYERRFGRIFIVCATDKPAAKILAILKRRLQNDAESELREAAEQQRQITHIRLKKWLQK
jgi:2-oxo-4-hydroxy-4-carboxy-5-ureidoimidazoline decarboxylase